MSFLAWNQGRRSWGTRASDFKTSVGRRVAKSKRRQKAKLTTQAKPVTQANQGCKRRLAEDVDGYSQFIELVTTYNSDSEDDSDNELDPNLGFNLDPNLEYDLDDDMDEDLEFGSDNDLDKDLEFDSDGDLDKESEFDLEKDDAVETTKQHMTLTLELAQEMIDDMCTACGPPPTLDSVPGPLRGNIDRHDKWYVEIFNRIFKEITRYSEETIEESPFRLNNFRWLSANADDTSREAILKVLLHPHVRSFRTRNALGKTNWDSLHSALESFPLMGDHSQIPAVIGTYTLLGKCRQGGALSHDMAYVGQAASLTAAINSSKLWLGVQRRALDHQIHISRIKSIRKIKGRSRKPKNEERYLWVHRRISHNDIAEVSLALLTVLPFPRCYMHEGSLHLPFLLTLAETIDMIYLGTIAQFLDDGSARKFGALHGHRLRPDQMPRSPFDGLNRAIPIKQPQQGFGALMIRVLWSPEDVAKFIDIFAQHHTSLYSHTRPRGIDWRQVLSLLEQQGVNMTKKHATRLHFQLSQHPDSGLITFSTSRWQQRWKRILEIKEFLEQKDLIEQPKSDDDLYYHVPALEGQLIYHGTILQFLKQAGFSLPTRCRDLESVLLFLPSLLHREVWNKITSTPPDFVKFTSEAESRYVAARVRQVVLFYARRGSGQLESHSLGSWTWHELLRVWHQSWAQLLEDGVPASRMPVFGPLMISKIYSGWRNSIPDTPTLPVWTYDPWLDTAKHRQISNQPNSDPPTTVSPDQCPFDYKETEVEGEEFVADNVVVDGLDWPLDAPRYSALLSSWPGYSRDKSKREQGTRSELRVKLRFATPLAIGGSVSSLRTLIYIMRDIHQRTFDESTESDALDLTDTEFWDCLYIGGLGPSWGIKDIRELKSRFGWVLDYIRAGYLPPEASLVRGVLQEALARSLLKSESHPYHQNGLFNPHELLNPDLSPS
ncbi:hypothetical protein TsFJ059_003028 [Trichoderma semiorbis]|uniref:Uncharacterized protein n=1 Tax=Trichoderma semiorbis TaxID=1491008 RepID=A0A9P8KTK6_9HYPO|nr:hypothetical protein TsFJ059_003028 [Trichoderma semiorbis]